MGGHFGKFWGKSEARILMMGLDAAGKTTILYRMKLGEVVTTIPTIGFNVETIDHKSFKLTAWDVGGRDKIRPLLRHYFPNTQALIYVVDSNDVERMDQVKEELHRFLEEDELRDTVLLVLANKQDLPNAKSPMFLVEKLELHKIRHKWHIIPAVATMGDGLKESLDWIVSAMTDKSTAVGEGKVPPKQTTSSVAAVGYFGKVWELIKSVFVETNDSETLDPSEGVK